jgi:hypothetical protein
MEDLLQTFYQYNFLSFTKTSTWIDETWWDHRNIGTQSFLKCDNNVD